MNRRAEKSTCTCGCVGTDSEQKRINLLTTGSTMLTQMRTGRHFINRTRKVGGGNIWMNTLAGMQEIIPFSCDMRNTSIVLTQIVLQSSRAGLYTGDARWKGVCVRCTCYALINDSIDLYRNTCHGNSRMLDFTTTRSAGM